MKIPLTGSSTVQASSGPAARSKALEKDIKAAKRGDWEARHRIERALQPLLNSLAQKRSKENAELNRLLEAGKAGIAIAIRKVGQDITGDRFQIFALPFIEAQMDKSRKQGWFARLFRNR